MDATVMELSREYGQEKEATRSELRSLSLLELTPASQVGHEPVRLPDEKTLRSLERNGLSKDQVQSIVQELNTKHTKPQDLLIRLLKENRVLCVGEAHYNGNPHRALGATAMQSLKDNGATHLAIETPPSSQPAIDEFVRSGNIDRTRLPEILRHDDFIELLQSARKAKLALVCVDDTNNRDKRMFEQIDTVLKASNKNKVVFWVGSYHLENLKDGNVSAGELLKNKYKTATVFADTPLVGSTALRSIASDAKHELGFLTADTSHTKELKVIRDTRLKHWDAVLFYPGKAVDILNAK